ncbi:unnamed protein product, partial [Brenthis ino]
MWISNIILLGVVVACSADTHNTSAIDPWTVAEEAILKEYDQNTNGDTQYTECEIDSSEIGVCVKKSLCSSPTVDPVTTFTLRSLNTNSRSRRDVVPKADSQENQCGWMEICCPTANVITPSAKPPPSALGCGYGNPGAVSLREMNDRATSAVYADFPWMVALMVKKNTPTATFTDEYIGGGTIIHPSVVMTVAHKVDKVTDPGTLKCRAGEWNWATKNEQYQYQERDVARIIIHEKYDKVYIHYNVALLHLKSAFDLTNAPHIGVACLEKTLPRAGSLCYSMGWGKDTARNLNNTKVLKKLTLPLVAGDVCQEQYRASTLGKRYKLHKTLTCAGGEAGVDTCIGDGGAPLVCPIPDKLRLRYSVVGMVTYGLGCGKENEPGVYAKVPEFYDWVAKQMDMTLKLNASTFVY